MKKFLPALVSLLVFSPVAIAQSPAPESSLLERHNLLGDPAGQRTQLNDAGWTPFATLYAELWGNVHGGVRKGMTDDFMLSFGAEADLQKIAGWQGGALRVSANYVQGTRPNHNTGAFESPTFLDASDHIRLYNLYFRQKLWDDQVTLKVGQLGFDDDFCQPPCLGSFLNAGITAPPVVYGQTLANGDGTLPQYPLDAPGVFMRYDPQALPLYSMTGLYLSDAGPDASNNHGFDWRASNSIALIHEIGWHYHLVSKDDNVAVGAFYNDGKFTNWDTGASERGIYGVYAFVNQALVTRVEKEGGDPKTVLSVFGYAGWSGPDVRTGPANSYAAGLNWNGPLACRPNDSVSFAVLYTGFSKHYTRSAINPNGPGATTAAETALELTYQMALTPWFSLQPDAQVIFNPANAGTRATAIVLGARAAISF